MNVTPPWRIDRDDRGHVLSIMPLRAVPVPLRQRRINVLSWEKGKTDRMVALLNDGYAFSAVARAMGETRNAIAGQVHRMRKFGDPRLPAPPLTLAKAMDAVAEEMAERCDTIEAAAERLGMPVARARLVWARVCRDLGRQSA